MSIISRDSINASEGQFGLTTFFNIDTDNITIFDDFINKPFRYLLTPTNTDYTVLLPTISNSNLNQTFFIQNTSSQFDILISNGNEIISTLEPSYASSFTARSETNNWGEVIQSFGTCITSVSENNFLTWKDTCWVSAPLPINTLTDVNITSPQDNDVIFYNGTEWVNLPFTLTSSGTFEGGVSINNSQVGVFNAIGSSQQTIYANLKTVYEGSPGDPTQKIAFDNLRGGLEIRNSVNTELETLFKVQDTGGDNIFNVSRTHLSGLGGQVPDTDSFSICMGTGATISTSVCDAIILQGGSTMDNAIAIKGSVSGSTDSIAIGVNSIASGSNPCIAFGRNTTSSGSFSIAIGDDATASNTDSISIDIGGGSSSGVSSISIGQTTTASGDNSICMGLSPSVTANRSVLFSSAANTCTTSDSVCIVANSTVSDKAVCLRGTARNGVSVGVSTSANGINSTSAGRSSASGQNSTYVGGTGGANTGDNSTCINSNNIYLNTVGIGGTIGGDNSVSLYSSTAANSTGIQGVVGPDSVCVGGRMFGIGTTDFGATGDSSLLISARMFLTGDNSICVTSLHDLNFAVQTITADRMVQLSVVRLLCAVPGTILLSTGNATPTSRDSINFSSSPGIPNIQNRYAKKNINFIQAPRHPSVGAIDQTTTALRTWFDQGSKTTTGNVTDSIFTTNKSIDTGDVFYMNTRLMGTHIDDGRVWSYYYLTNVKNISGIPTFSSNFLKKLESNISLNGGDPLVLTGVTDAIQFGITTTGLTASDTIKWNMFLDIIPATP